MPILYQHELRRNLISLNEESDCTQVDNLMNKITNCIKLNKKYFPDDYLVIFDEITKDSASFENLFNLLLNSSPVKEEPLKVFLPIALYDICTDLRHDFIGQTQQKLLEIVKDDEKYPETNELYSKITNYDEEFIDSEYEVTKSQASHTLNTGNQLIEFLKSYVELEKADIPVTTSEDNVKQDASWTSRVLPSEASSNKRPVKKSTSFAESVKGASDNDTYKS